MNTTVYDIITERILALLEKGVCPWRRPWSQLNIVPQNFATGRAYNGVNFLLLSAMGFELPLFMTFRQVAERGGSVRKGSRGLPVVYWSTLESEEEADKAGKPKRIPFLRYYTVFNAEQIEGIEFPRPATERPFMTLEAAEAVMAGWADAPKITHGKGRACYRIAFDDILMPSRTSFHTPEEYYSTLFHEAGHATGAAHRLNRTFGKRFGDEDYSREELVAEMTAAFLCAHCGIDNHVIENQAAYLDGWMRELKSDKRLVVTAAGQAQRAVNLILGLKPAPVEPLAVA